MKKIFLILISLLILIIGMNITYASDVLLWQGQYYSGTRFNTGTYEFNFSVYDALIGGDICYSNITNLTTGNFGEWKTEQYNVSSSCNNVSKDYYLNIKIGGIDQIPRKRLMIWNFLRKDVDEITSGKIQTNAQVIAPIIKADAQIVAPIVNATRVVANEINITGNVNILGILRGHSPLRIGDSIQFVDTNGSNLFSLYTSGQNITGNNVSSQYSGVIIHQIETHTNPSGIEECWWDKEDQEMRMCMDKTNIEMWNNLIVNKNISSAGNVTAAYFIGDGSSLTNLPGGGNSSWNESYADAKYLNLSGTNANQNVNIDSYNFTANNGFFSYLGNLTNRISQIWTMDINATGNITTTGKIQGNYSSMNGLQGITNTTGYRVCTKFQGQNCQTWCTLQINDGIITGCS